MKQTWIMLAAALIVAVGMGCGGSKSVSTQPTQQQQTTAQTSRSPTSAPVAQTVSANKTPAIDELDVAIRDASDCLNDNIPKGSKIVILNIESNSANLSEYIIDELIANAINDKNFSVVDRRQLEAIQAEQKFQMSGAVDDKDALAIGKFFGAQTIISGAMREMGGRYRMTVRALAVQTAVVQSQCNQNIAIAASATLTDLVSSGGSRPVGGAVVYGGKVAATSSKTAQPVTQVPAQPTAITVEGASLTEKLQWLEANAANNTEYRVEVTGNESLGAPTLSYPRRRNITIRLISSEGERILSLTGNGSIFTVEADVTLILDKGITLQGRDQNNGSLVRVNGRGTLIMNAGAKIVGNTSQGFDGYGKGGGGGVFVDGHGNFTMVDGEISGNISRTDRGGGGVYVSSGGNFTMTGGMIYGNNAYKNGGFGGNGGGVAIAGNFTMSGGEITGNTADHGGGVYLSDATFTMRGGEIHGNTVIYSGGGVWLTSGQFAMIGGIISGNTSNGQNCSYSFYGGGGGVCIENGIFTKTGGTIYGSTGVSNDNRACNGFAVYRTSAVSSREWRIRNSTAGPEVKLDLSKSGAAGGWEN